MAFQSCHTFYTFAHVFSVNGDDGDPGCGPEMWDSDWFRHPECLTKQEETAIQRAMADEDEENEPTQCEQQSKDK